MLIQLWWENKMCNRVSSWDIFHMREKIEAFDGGREPRRRKKQRIKRSLKESESKVTYWWLYGLVCATVWYIDCGTHTHTHLHTNGDFEIDRMIRKQSLAAYICVICCFVSLFHSEYIIFSSIGFRVIRLIYFVDVCSLFSPSLSLSPFEFIAQRTVWKS